MVEPEMQGWETSNLKSLPVSDIANCCNPLRFLEVDGGRCLNSCEANVDTLEKFEVIVQNLFLIQRSALVLDCVTSVSVETTLATRRSRHDITVPFFLSRVEECLPKRAQWFAIVEGLYRAIMLSVPWTVQSCVSRRFLRQARPF